MRGTALLDVRPQMRDLVLLAGLCTCVASCSGVDNAPARGTDTEMEAFLTSYFESWSRGDMKTYGEHFLPAAVVASLHNGILAPWVVRHRFVEQQRMLRERGGRAHERMLSFTVDRDAQAATVVAQWELVKGAGPDRRATRGVDRFTLIKDDSGDWKIASLVFYSTE